MNHKAEQALQYARDRVHTTPVPAGLSLRQERRRAFAECVTTFALFGILGLLVNIGLSKQPSIGAPIASPWLAANIAALDLESGAR